MASKISRLISAISLRVGKLISWLTALLVLVICYDVSTRYIFDYSEVWMLELEWHLFALIFLLGAAYTLQQDRHVRVDVFYSRFSANTRAWVNLFGSLLLLFPFCWVILDASWEFAMFSFKAGERSADPGGLPALYLIKASIWLGFLLLCLQGICLVLDSIMQLLMSDADQKRTEKT